MQNKLRTNTTTIGTMMNDIQPNLRQYLVRDSLVLDILPYMLEILQPRLRQVEQFSHFLRRSIEYVDEHRSVYEQRITRHQNIDRCDDRLQSLVHSTAHSQWRECTRTRTVSRATRTTKERNSFAVRRFRPVDGVSFFSDGHEKRGLPFGTRQMIFKELLKERVKRNIRLKSDKHEMPVAVQRSASSNVHPFVLVD